MEDPGEEGDGKAVDPKKRAELRARLSDLKDRVKGKGVGSHGGKKANDTPCAVDDVELTMEPLAPALALPNFDPQEQKEGTMKRLRKVVSNSRNSATKQKPCCRRRRGEPS